MSSNRTCEQLSGSARALESPFRRRRAGARTIAVSALFGSDAQYHLILMRRCSPAPRFYLPEPTGKIIYAVMA
jgi:hypothetical protein